LIEQHTETDAPFFKLVVEFQRDCLEDHGLEKDFGCRKLSSIPTDYPTDVDLHNRVKRFMFM
jgi:hypothetical protein